MRQAASIALAIAMTIACCDNSDAPLVIKHPCNTFVSEFGPEKTPRLERTDTGLVLILSFTPAEDREAKMVMDAVRHGPTTFRIQDKNVGFLAQKITASSHLVIPVTSEANARTLLRDLCFEEDALRNEPEQRAAVDALKDARR